MSISLSLPVKRSAYHFCVWPRYLPFQAPPTSVARNIVGQPLGNLAEALDRADIGFLAQLAQRRRPRVLAGIDAALRHLPDMPIIDVLGTIDAPADESEPGAIEHRQAGAGAIGKIFEGHVG